MLLISSRFYLRCKIKPLSNKGIVIQNRIVSRAASKTIQFLFQDYFKKYEKLHRCMKA